MTSLAYGVMGTDYQERINFERMRKERLAKLQAAMKKHNISALLLFDGNNIRYVSGVRGPQYYFGLRYALAFAEHDPIIYELGDTLDRNREHAKWVKPENWRYSYSWLGGAPGPEASQETAKKWVAGILQDLKDKGLEKEKLGIDMVDAVAAGALAGAGIQFADGNAALVEARTIKTADEINCLRMANVISNLGFRRALEELKVGVRQCDVAAAATDAVMRAGAEFAWVGVTAGPDTFELYHLPNSDKIIDVGDLVQVQFCGTSYMGYSTCVYRTFIVGRKPNKKEQDFYKTCHDRVYSVLDKVKPGSTTADAAQCMCSAKHWGYDEEEPLLEAEIGHGMGHYIEGPIISRIWSLDHPQELKPGMVIAFESREGERNYGGVRLEEMVVVTETGNEMLTTWPADEIMPADVLP